MVRLREDLNVAIVSAVSTFYHCFIVSMGLSCLVFEICLRDGQRMDRRRMAIFRRGLDPLVAAWRRMHLGHKRNRDFRPISRFSAKLIQHRAIVTMERQQKLDR